MKLLMLAFVVTPVVEMYLLLEIGAYLGAWMTIGLVILTAVVGLSLLRQEGFRTLSRGLKQVGNRQLPAHEIVEGVLLAIAGALLLTPGFVTDGLGFMMLVPVFRRTFAEHVVKRLGVENFVHSSGEGSSPGKRSKGETLEGDFEQR